MTLDITIEVKTMIDDLQSRGYRRPTIARGVGVSEYLVVRWANCRSLPKEDQLTNLYLFYNTARPVYEVGMFGGSL